MFNYKLLLLLLLPPARLFATKKRQLTRPKWNGNKWGKKRKEWKKATNQSSDICVHFLRLISITLTRSLPFQHLKVPVIFLSGPDAIYFLLIFSLQPILLYFFCSICWCVVLCLPFQFIHLFIHTLSFPLPLSLSRSLSLSLTYSLCLTDCLSVCLSLCMSSSYAVPFQDFFFRTLCGVRARYALFVCFLSLIVAPSIYWVVFLSVCARKKTSWNDFTTCVRARI